VGASSRPDAVGHALFKNLLFGAMHGSDRAEGFPGPVYGVNQKAEPILGHATYPSLKAIGAPVDLALVAIPPKYVLGVIEEAAELGTTAVIIISAGFGEMGAEGKALEDACVKAARARGVRLIGPNCLGVMSPGAHLNA